MATTAAGTPTSAKVNLKPELYDRILTVAALALLAAVGTAIWKGRAEWGEVPELIWAHIATIVVALVLTPVMLMRRRGDRLHRVLGWIWATAMTVTAASSFGIRGLNQGSFSLIHILSAWTLIQVPVIVWAARTHNVARHRGAVRGMVTGALIIAGVFTFPFDRLMGEWLFG